MMSMSNMTGMSSGKKKKTMRGKRGGKGKHKGANAHHVAAKEHLASAMATNDPHETSKFLFKALTHNKKAIKAKSGSPIGAAPSTGTPTMGSAPMAQDTDNDSQ